MEGCNPAWLKDTSLSVRPPLHLYQCLHCSPWILPGRHCCEMELHSLIFICMLHQSILELSPCRSSTTEEMSNALQSAISSSLRVLWVPFCFIYILNAYTEMALRVEIEWDSLRLMFGNSCTVTKVIATSLSGQDVVMWRYRVQHIHHKGPECV